MPRGEEKGEQGEGQGESQGEDLGQEQPEWMTGKYHKLDVWKVPRELAEADMTTEERRRTVHALATHADTEFPANSANEVVPMPWYEELLCMVIMMVGVPGAPIFFLALGVAACFLGGLWGAGAVLAGAILLGVMPAAFHEHWLNGYISQCLLRYFSFRGIWSTYIDDKQGYILSAPPHGVLPLGNILTMLAFPKMVGFSFKGLAATAALHVPLYRQLLVGIGAIDASRHVARAALENGKTIGISTGGIAEIFESTPTKETIILSRRQGMVRLAMRTGSPIVPCYLLGNTPTLSVWYDSAGIMQALCRKLRVAIVPFWGRFGLPIPYRVPITGIMGDPIYVKKQDPEGKEEEVEEILQELIRRHQVLFDTHKAAYGWADKELHIK